MSSPPPEPPDRRSTPSKPAPSPVSALQAVACGLLVDLGGSALIGLVLDMVYASQLASGGMTPEQVDEALKNVPPDSAVAILGMLLGFLCAVAGGFVCARMARRDEYRLGAILAMVSVFISLALGGDESDDMTVLLCACEFACVLLGAKYGRERNQAPVAVPGGDRKS